MPKFSIVLATRDRPALFQEALDSVLAQDFDNFEIIVVNDGSTEENAAIYREILDRAQVLHGAFRSRFIGWFDARKATGKAIR